MRRDEGHQQCREPGGHGGERDRTDLLTGFVSKKGRRFKAFLVKTPDGKIGFEFQARAAKDKPEEAKKRRRAA